MVYRITVLSFHQQTPCDGLVDDKIRLKDPSLLRRKIPDETSRTFETSRSPPQPMKQTRSVVLRRNFPKRTSGQRLPPSNRWGGNREGVVTHEKSAKDIQKMLICLSQPLPKTKQESDTTTLRVNVPPSGPR
ncbi:hypothetical protein NPIL_660171 [Nephila pilipes]|uniref:Uncharacterized protein n=1 Tax=Nephila pilipes TaxID=299642 RepID=A0A8X6JZ51_NEPPI|nr:hypothetical protein NPIL_660171 [Nephila pilipes]